MAGSMKDIKLRIKSVESTMQITKAMELVASSKMRRAKERVEHSRPYFETLHETLTKIAAADPRARNPYLRRDEVKRTLLIVIAGDRGLAGGYNSNVLKQAAAEEGEVLVLPIGKRSAEYFVHHEVPLFTQEVLLAADVSVDECFQLSHQITEGYLKGEYDAAKRYFSGVPFSALLSRRKGSTSTYPFGLWAYCSAHSTSNSSDSSLAAFWAFGSATCLCGAEACGYLSLPTLLTTVWW